MNDETRDIITLALNLIVGAMVVIAIVAAIRLCYAITGDANARILNNDKYTEANKFKEYDNKKISVNKIPKALTQFCGNEELYLCIINSTTDIELFKTNTTSVNYTTSYSTDVNDLISESTMAGISGTTEETMGVIDILSNTKNMDDEYIAVISYDDIESMFKAYGYNKKTTENAIATLVRATAYTNGVNGPVYKYWASLDVMSQIAKGKHPVTIYFISVDNFYSICNTNPILD